MFGQSPTFALKGFDALNLLTVNHPGSAETLTLQPSVLEQSIDMLDVVAQLVCRLLYRQRSFHLPLSVTQRLHCT